MQRHRFPLSQPTRVYSLKNREDAHMLGYPIEAEMGLSAYI